MAVIAYLVLFLTMTGHSNALYCLCKAGLSQSVLQKALDYACGAGADCNPILQNGACYNPNTLQDHCNYAVNSYFQRKGQTQGSCDFAGAAATSANPPSNVPSSCVFPSSSTSNGTAGTPTTTPTTTPSTTPSTTSPGTSTVFGGAGTTLGPTGSGIGGINDASGGVMALFKPTNLFLSMALTLCASGLTLLWG